MVVMKVCNQDEINLAPYQIKKWQCWYIRTCIILRNRWIYTTVQHKLSVYTCSWTLAQKAGSTDFTSRAKWSHWKGVLLLVHKFDVLMYNNDTRISLLYYIINWSYIEFITNLNITWINIIRCSKNQLDRYMINGQHKKRTSFIRKLSVRKMNLGLTA